MRRDCHVHFSGQTAGVIDGLFGASQALAGARTAADAAITLNSGFTTVREVGGFGIDVAQAINEGIIVGPNVYSTSAAISTTGGHGDVHTVPIDAVRAQQAKGVPILGICDGVDECIKTVRLNIRRGAKVIKICATGGVGSEMDDPEDRQFSDEEIRAMVQEAARSKRIVAAHAHGKEGILAAVRNGVKTIEHGSYLDEEVAEEMKKHDAIFIATRCIVEGGVLQKEFWSPRQYAKLLALYEQGKTAYKIAVKSGVKIALGTDSCVSGGKDKLMYHGTAGKELYFAVQAGMTPLQAIEACTATAPETLGPQKPASGMLEEGYDADIIAVSENPLDDIDVLSKPSNITHVWKGGKLFKSL